MRQLDEHWLAWPEFMAGGVGPVERLKLRLLVRPRLRYLDTLLPPRTDPEPVLRRFGVEAGKFVLVVPGGGTAHRGARSAPEIALEGASRIARRGHPTVLVGLAPEVQGDEAPALRRSPRIPMEELCELLRAAKLVVTNGGDTLLQGIALGRACVAVPIADDQPFRIAACVREGLAVAAELAPESIERQAAALLDDDARRAALERHVAAHGLANGLDTALDALAGLLGRA
jgi:UDP:flavonoid glycosyltransferase YjiC (YdhE family)